MIKKFGNRYFGELSDLVQFVKNAGTLGEQVWICPYCLELTGRSDRSGHFYYNSIKQVGKCFKCETIITSDEIRSIEAIRQQLDSPSDEEAYNNQVLNFDTWTTKIRACKDYLVRRRGIWPQTIEKFELRETSYNQRAGVVFINKLFTRNNKTYTDFLQIRNIGEDIKQKYSNLAGVIKPLCWTERVTRDTVMLVEGFISGMAAWQHVDGEIDPLIMLGKSLNKIQLKQLKILCLTKDIKKVFVICDGGFLEDSIKIARVLGRELYSQEIMVTKLFYDKDPAELTRAKFKLCLKDRSWPYIAGSEARFRQQAYHFPGKKIENDNAF